MCGPPAGIGSSTTCHAPSAPALAVLALAGDLDRDLLARLGPAPDAVFLIALQDHVGPEDGRHLHVASDRRILPGDQS